MLPNKQWLGMDFYQVSEFDPCYYNLVKESRGTISTYVVFYQQDWGGDNDCNNLYRANWIKKGYVL